MRLLAEQAGHQLDLTHVDGRTMIDASIAGMNGNDRPMQQLLAGALDRSETPRQRLEAALAARPSREEILQQLQELEHAQGIDKDRGGR